MVKTFKQKPGRGATACTVFQFYPFSGNFEHKKPSATEVTEGFSTPGGT